MKKIIALLLCIVTVLSMSLTGCSQNKPKTVINVYNWGEYIDTDIFDEFTKETGIGVNYTNFEDLGEQYAKLKSGGGEYDLIFSSDFMIERMISEDMLEKLDMNNIPNYSKVDSKYKGLSFDPNDEYSVPYMWGVLGIVYNKTMVDDVVDSWDILWNEKYSKQILMCKDSRDAFGIAHKKLGQSFNTTDEGEIQKAADELAKQRPLVQAYVMDQVFDKMINEEAAIAVYYGGDCVNMMSENEDLDFALPKEGTNFFIDSLVIPKGAKNKAAAEAFINFLCDPETSLKNCDVTCYSTPITEAYDMLEDDVKNNPNLYPSEDFIKNSCETYKNLPTNVWDLYETLWIDVMTK